MNRNLEDVGSVHPAQTLDSSVEEATMMEHVANKSAIMFRKMSFSVFFLWGKGDRNRQGSG